MSVEYEVHRAGGVIPTSELLNGGFTNHAIARAVAEGALQRPRRGWVALPNADPALLYAARYGVVLSCITQAKRLGLWVLEHDRAHVAVRVSNKKATAPGSVLHWRTPLVIRPRAMLADHLENVLDCAAACQPHDAALAIWDSAMQKQLIDYQALASLPLKGSSKALLAECTPFSDSGLETFLRTRLAWLRVPMRWQAWLHGHRVDFLIGDRLVVQVDGLHHAGGQRTSDNRHDAALALRGYHVIRVGYAEIVHRWHEVEAEILAALARGLHTVR